MNGARYRRGIEGDAAGEDTTGANDGQERRRCRNEAGLIALRSFIRSGCGTPHFSSPCRPESTRARHIWQLELRRNVASKKKGRDRAQPTTTFLFLLGRRRRLLYLL